MIKLDAHTNIIQVVNAIDQSMNGIPIPGVQAKAVDYNFDGMQYHIIVEIKRGQANSVEFQEFNVLPSSGFGSLTSAVVKYRQRYESKHNGCNVCE
jgi:hypothetical protein